MIAEREARGHEAVIDANNKSEEYAMPKRIGLRVLSKMIRMQWSELAHTAQFIHQNAGTYSLRVISQTSIYESQSSLTQQSLSIGNALKWLHVGEAGAHKLDGQSSSYKIAERPNHDTWIWRCFTKYTHGIHLFWIQITTRKSGVLLTNIGMWKPALLPIALPIYRIRSHNDNY